MKNSVKRWLSLCLSLCLLTGGVGAFLPRAEARMLAATYEDFGDLPDFPWYVNYMNKALDNGFFQGVSPTLFRPDRAISRGEAVTVLGRVHEKISGETIPETEGQPFEDVAPGWYYTRYIAWAKESNILFGVTEDAFEPDRAVTQQELAVLFARYIGTTEKKSLYQPLNDVDVSGVDSWAQEDVRSISGFEIFAERSFQPKEEAKRGDCAAFFVRLYEKLTYPVAEETPRQKYRYHAPEEYYELDEQFRILEGTDTEEGKRVQIIEDYETYSALMEKLNQYGQAGDLSLAVTEDTFAEHNILAVEIQETGTPQFDVELGGYVISEAKMKSARQEGETEDGAQDDTQESQPEEGTEIGTEPESSEAEVETFPQQAELTLLLEGYSGGSTADIVGCVFFLKVPKGVDEGAVTLNTLCWTSGYWGIGSLSN